MTRRVLVLDDEPGIRRAFKRNLQQLGYQITEAGSVLEATELLDHGARFDIALIDWELGTSLTGLVIAKRLRHEQPECARIIVSGHSIAKMRAEWEDPLQAILAFVQKPVVWPEFAALLERIERSRGDTPPRGTPIG